MFFFYFQDEEFSHLSIFFINMIMIISFYITINIILQFIFVCFFIIIILLPLLPPSYSFSSFFLPIISLFLNLPFNFIQQSSQQPSCSLSSQFQIPFSYLFPLLHLCIYYFLSFFLLLTVDIFPYFVFQLMQLVHTTFRISPSFHFLLSASTLLRLSVISSFEFLV